MYPSFCHFRSSIVRVQLYTPDFHSFLQHVSFLIHPNNRHWLLDQDWQVFTEDEWLYLPVTMTYCSTWRRDSFRQPAVNSLCSLTCLTFTTVQLPDQLWLIRLQGLKIAPCSSTDKELNLWFLHWNWIFIYSLHLSCSNLWPEHQKDKKCLGLYLIKMRLSNRITSTRRK